MPTSFELDCWNIFHWRGRTVFLMNNLNWPPQSSAEWKCDGTAMPAVPAIYTTKALWLMGLAPQNFRLCLSHSISTGQCIKIRAGKKTIYDGHFGGGTGPKIPKDVLLQFARSQHYPQKILSLLDFCRHIITQTEPQGCPYLSPKGQERAWVFCPSKWDTSQGSVELLIEHV